MEVRSNPEPRLAPRSSRLAEPDVPRAADFVFVENWARANDLSSRRILLVENNPDVMEATHAGCSPQ
ncbi:MAG: hypothetical protein H6872_11145 [Methylobacteriaceae bacterium]|nr:hypothetical protein [Methylobacteriaceae bacterium]